MRTRSQSKRIIHIALLIVCALFSAARAQNSAPSQANGTGANANEANASPAVSPTPIPVSDVITQAENASATLKEIAASASADRTASTIERDLPALTEEINSRLEATALTIEGSTSLDDLRSFESDWRTLTDSLPGWRGDLTTRARLLENDLRRTTDLIDRWQKTLEELRAAEAPPEIISRVEEIIRTAGDVRRVIAAQQARAVALQNRVAEQQSRVTEALATISARREALVDQLLVQDSPAIWNADFWRQENILAGLGDSLRSQADGLRAFAVRNKDKLIIHILVFAALAGFLFYLRRRARPLVEANPDLKESAVIFYLPIPTALALAILFNSRIYPQTPQILGAIFGAIAIVPTVIILRKLVGQILYPLLYSLVAFYFIDQLRAISENVPSLSRPLFLAEMAAAFGVFLWFYLERREDDPPEDVRGRQVFRFARTFSLIALPLFAVAFLANVFGYSSLSRLVGNAVLRSAYAAIILYAVVRIVEGLLVFALRLRPLNLLKMARDHAVEIQAKARKLIRFVAFVLWVVITLEQFTLREIVFRRVTDLLTAELVLGSLSISALDVLLFFAIVWAAILISRFVRFALEEDVYPRLSLAHGIPYAISTIVNYVLLLVGFFFAVGAAGFDLTRFTVLVGAFGVGIGFGLQNIFNNFVSGLILLFERPVRVGDEIDIGGASGTVKRIGIRASRVRQWDNSEIIVPNSKLISETVKNWSYTVRKRGIEIPISVAHGTDSSRVIELLKEAAAEHPLVAERPAPQVIIGEIAPPALNFKLRAWTAQFDKTTKIAADISIAISQKLAQNNIEIPQVTPNLTS